MPISMQCHCVDDAGIHLNALLHLPPKSQPLLLQGKLSFFGDIKGK
jgi:hypothetical protein